MTTCFHFSFLLVPAQIFCINLNSDVALLPHCHPNQSKVTRCPVPGERAADKAQLESLLETAKGSNLEGDQVGSESDKAAGKTENFYLKRGTLGTEGGDFLLDRKVLKS